MSTSDHPSMVVVCLGLADRYLSRARRLQRGSGEGCHVQGSSISAHSHQSQLQSSPTDRCLYSPQLLLTTWRGTRFEVIQVLNEVLDAVLFKDKDITDEQLVLRAKAVMTVGAIFKATVADESDEERRELERCVPCSLFFFSRPSY